MTDDLQVSLTPEQTARLAEFAALHGQTSEEYASSLLAEALDGPFGAALDRIRPRLAQLAEVEQPEEPQPEAPDTDAAEEAGAAAEAAPMSSRDLPHRAA